MLIVQVSTVVRTLEKELHQKKKLSPEWKELVTGSLSYVEKKNVMKRLVQILIWNMVLNCAEKGSLKQYDKLRMEAFEIGYKTSHEVKGLEPGNYYNFRVGVSCSEKDKVTWSGLLIGTTKEEPVAITDIHQAIRKGNLSALRQLISSRMAAVDIYNTRGLTPLMEASATGDIGAMGILLWAGSNVEQGSAGVGKTALMISLQNGHIKAATKLCEAGAQWETKDRCGCTALHYAVEASQVEAVDFALVNGANIEAKDTYGWTPLMRALIVRSSMETLKELLKNGADVNVAKAAIYKDADTPTPIMCAVLSCHSDNDPFMESIQLLIQNGAKTEEVNAYGHKAADMALAKGCKAIVNDLESAGQLSSNV
ncbi:fibronectin type 3 and ankyrin repeat domains protein 1-like [Hetaerina americana]|uniref:fibronectin type 3 and ankyrin repeat domains protein 1-like n=1 Tax=Hetaerina americana TaxID=62018 RepID=UPI003A7F5C9C